ncbi:uncharacterized protein SOCE26_048760 [Sorangium cellulosum]|uniref:Uncharacterized protein n=1 Tax=Sorangium cellulosum TaxID=56 RepID=A0A2L0EVU9_SORCE|nr:hypothetical protein [Sorangium cellulosum]AUX43428.1 uncharacterized protein SOCE26_048760 [Sorangium cellulosum]
MPNLLQWVNLDRDNKFVEDEVTSIERLGPVRFEVTFKKSKAARFRIRTVPVSEPSTYTPTEVARNQNFKIRHARTQTNAGRRKVKITEDVFLPAAGGNSYKLQAKYRNKVKESRVVETRRKIHYQPVAMATTPVPNMGPTEAYYGGLFLLLKSKGGNGTIPFKTNVRVDDWASGRLPLIQAVKGAYTIDNYKPWAFAAVYVNMIASRQEKEFLPATSPVYNVGARISNWGSQQISFQLPGGTYLWWGLEPADDAANGGKGVWLVSNSCKFIESGGAVHNIPDANVTIDLTVTRSALGGYSKLNIEIPVHVRDFWSGKSGRIGIKLKVVKGFSGGYSEPQINIITVAKRAWWDENSDTKRLQILCHEMGHKFGMVPEGLGAGLDAGAHLYGGSLNPAANQKGHQGPHCENGAVYTPGGAPAPWIGSPACVMFGATSCYNTAAAGHLAAPSTFCGDCEPQVKKLDLDGRGLAGFTNSVTSY